MAQQNASPKRRSTCGCLAALFVFVFLLIIAGGALWYFFLQPPQVALGPVVSLTSPETGSTSEVNRPLQVSALAEDADGAMRVELYADGALVAAQETTLPQGSNPLLFMQNWVPLTTGRHVLLARGYDRTGKFADSSVVQLDVVELLSPTRRVSLDDIPRGPNVPLPSLNQVVQLSGVPADRLRNANPSLRDVNPDSPLPGGTTIDVPRSPAPPPTPGGGTPGGGTPASPPPPPLPIPGAPAAPTGLTGTGDCTSVQLAWADSPEEESYVVYRLGPGDVRLNPIATLPANSVNYRDTFTLPGVYRYQVAAARGTLEGLSGMFTYTTPGTCVPPPPPPGTLDLLLTFISIETTTPYLGTYCYFSINGSAPERAPGWPTEMSPSSGNPLLFQLSQLRDHGLVPLPRHPESNPVTFSVNCQGRHGLLSEPLGIASASHPRADWDGTERVATADSFRLRYRIGPDTPAARRGSVPLYWGELSPEVLRRLLASISIIPEPINIRYNPNGREACDQVPSGFLGLGRILCETVGRPTITWEWRGDNSRIGGFRVEIDSIAGSPPVGPTSRAVLVPPEELARSARLYCGSRLDFSVIVMGTDRSDRARADGNHFELPPCPTGPATVEVTFDELVVGGSAAHGGHIEDDDTCIFCTDRRMELFGDFVVFSGTSANEFDLRAWYDSQDVLQPAGGFFDQLARAIDFLIGLPGRILAHLFGSCSGYTCVSDPGGTYRWASLPLDTINERPGPNKNTLRVQARDGASLTVAINLKDGPTGFSVNNDPYCVARVEFPARTAREWATVDETRTINQDFGEASCRITFRVRGRAP